MAIKRYIASKDATITNAFQSNLTTRGTGSNSGLADSLETFVIYGQASSSSVEYSRILVEFPISSIVEDRNDSFIPISGSVSYYLKLYNVEHSLTLPRKFTVVINPISRSWDEGYGLDLDEYGDNGIVNWKEASSGSTGVVQWSNEGGDYHTGLYVPGSTLPTYTTYFEDGYENLEVDITSLVEEWIAGTKENYGIGIYMTSSIESAVSSSYTKRFSARGSEYFFKRPIIEARWDDSKKDNRINFYASSSLAPAADNLNTLFLYNRVRGRLVNIPGIGTGSIYVKAYTSAGVDLTPTPITGGYYETGIYTASFALNTTASAFYPKWYGAGLTTLYHSEGAVTIKGLSSGEFNSNQQYVVSMPDLKSNYNIEEKPRFRVFTREKNWNPNTYVVAIKDPELSVIDNLYYRIKRVKDNSIVVDYGTGSLNHTRLSYDVSGSYFDFDISLLEKDYMYAIELIYKTEENPDKYRKVNDVFKFRVE